MKSGKSSVANLFAPYREKHSQQHYLNFFKNNVPRWEGS